MSKEFDLIVIGTGSAGSVAASKCAKEGWNVAMIDSRPFGGTCALRGCDPKKVLVGAAELIDFQERMNGNGIHSTSQINWSELMKFKRNFTEEIPEKKEEGLQEQGITTFHGLASFVSENEVKVDGDQLKGKYILIATGAKPTPLPISGSQYLIHSDDFLELDELPKRIVFVGGGYISFEFAHIAARAGAEVHIVQRSEKPLQYFDPDLVDVLIKKSESIGINLHFSSSVTEVEESSGGYVVHADRHGEELSLEADLVVHGAGRTPATEELQLEKGNVESEKGGVSVNKYLQSTSNPNVYAAGDVASTEGLPLTPIAGKDSHVVASNLLKGNEEVPDYKVIPTVTFTLPKLARVGMTEEEAKEAKYNVAVNHLDTSTWFTYKRTNEQYTSAKVIIDKDTKQVIGAHLLSNEADELINHFAMAIQFNLTTLDIKTMNFAYPTTATDLPYMLS